MKNITLKLALAFVICACTVSWAQTSIPTIRITTQNNQEPTVGGGGMGGWGFGGAQTMNYVKITRFQLEGAGSYNLDLTPEPTGEADSIRVRGNSTASADKKPYRIKFDKKRGLFGKNPAKSWVLLANYYDPTFTMNAIAFRLGQKMGLAYTPTSQFVQVYINGSYKGLYQLTEQIQVGQERINIDPDYGFLVEFDYHDAESDEIKFSAAQYSLPTFIKSPEVTSNFNVNNSRVKWVKDSVDAVMRKMGESGFPTNGYRDMIDLESFAKYVLIQQFMDNFDFNSKTQSGAVPGSNYAYKNVGKKIMAGPLWDFDLSAGVKAPGGMGGFPGMGGGGGGCEFPTHFCMYDEPIKPKHTFYQRLWADPEFLAYFKTTWETYKSDFTAIPTFIDSIAGFLRNGVDGNKYAASMNASGNLNTSTYNTQVSNMKTWWGNRMTFFGTEVGKLNTGTITPPTTGFTLQVARTPTAGGNVSVNNVQNPSGTTTYPSGTSITITATPNTGYTFQNWTAVSGSLPSGVTATSATITFSISAAVNIRANFAGGTGGGQTYTLQVSRSPSAGGSVSVNSGAANPQGSQSFDAGTSVTVKATPNAGYTFQSWTAVSGTLPAGITATSATITFPLNANANIRANFQNAGGGSVTNYTLNAYRSSRAPASSGSVKVTVDDGAPQTDPGSIPIPANTSVTVEAVASSGYSFANWELRSGSLPAGFSTTSASNTFDMTGALTVSATFQEGGPIVTPGGNMTDTIAVVEAEDFVERQASNNDQLRVVTNNSTGITAIGYIESGNRARYSVDVERSGEYKLVFKIASNYDQGQSSFRVTVNGYGDTDPAYIISGKTNDWDVYTDVALAATVNLAAGGNTIWLNFQTPVNVDYFVILGDKDGVGVRYSAPRAVKTRAAVTLRAIPRGFTAALPSNHAYTQYRLIDLKGREVRRGKIGPGVTDLRFDGLKRSVLFLKLDGAKGGKPLVLRAVTY